MTTSRRGLWTISFFCDHIYMMTLASLLRYRDFLIKENRGTKQNKEYINLKMRNPIKGNIFMRVLGSDLCTFREILDIRVYEPVVYRVPNCRYVVDLGANIGLATRYFAAQYTNCEVLAVEPDLANYELLKQNVEGLVRAGRCRTIRAAAWSHHTTVIPEAPVGTEGRHNAIQVREAEDSGDLGVPALTVAELIEQSGFPRVDLLKIDVEGAEAQLFGGDLKWLSLVDAIAIEFHGGSREASGFDQVALEHGLSLDDSHPHTTIAYRTKLAR